MPEPIEVVVIPDDDIIHEIVELGTLKAAINHISVVPQDLVPPAETNRASAWGP